VQPEEFIEFAKRLLNDPAAPEADLRLAAHAAYYGVYHLACAHFNIDPTSRTLATHGEVRARLKALNPTNAPAEIKESKRVMQRLFDRRCAADYDLKTQFTAEDAEDAVEMAKGVFAKAKVPIIQVAKQPPLALKKGAEPAKPAPVPAVVADPPTAQSSKA